jgi:hypothetical protein
MNQMFALSMVRQNPDGSWEPLDFDEDYVLKATGTEGASKRHRARLNAEREVWWKYREERYGERLTPIPSQERYRLLNPSESSLRANLPE